MAGMFYMHIVADQTTVMGRSKWQKMSYKQQSVSSLPMQINPKTSLINSTSRDHYDSRVQFPTIAISVTKSRHLYSGWARPLFLVVIRPMMFLLLLPALV